jgi:hypothetical protein
MTVDHRKKVIVEQHGDRVHEEHVVRDLNLEYRETVYKITQLIWLLFGGLEALIGMRVILMLIGANPASWFTAFIYQLTQLFLWPFQNIVANPSIQNITLEVTSLIAMLVYAIVGWIFVRLIWVVFHHTSTTRVTTYDRKED